MTTTGVKPAASVVGLTVADSLLVDTNIWVFASSPTAPEYDLAVATLGAVRAAGVSLRTSRQVFREYVSAMTKRKPYAGPVPMAEVVANLGPIMLECLTAEDGPAVTAEWFDLLNTVPCGGKQVHDANIVATMRVHGVPNLLTHNVKDFTRFAGLVTVVPLVP